METEKSVPLLDELTKKDEDLVVIENSFLGTIIETHLDVGYDMDDDEEEEPLTLEILSIPMRIIRHVLIINIAIAFLYTVFGLVPYGLLQEAPRFVPWVLFAVSSVSSIACATLMHRYRRKQWALALSLYVMWVLITFVVVCTLAASLRSFAPFQACTMFFMQCIVGLLYCLYAGKDNVNAWWAAGLMMFAGLCVWSMGLYSFVREQDWITSGVLFVVCVLFWPLYTAYELHLIDKRYTLEELTMANIEFVTDVFILPFERIRRPPALAESQ
jgi:hypothetical protein